MNIRGKFGSSIPRDVYFATRNDPLNIRLGGGLPFGSLHEIFGAEGLFKTTMCAEIVADALAQGAWAIVHDREGRLNAGRLSSVGADIDSDRLIYKNNNPHNLTVESSFEHAAEVTAAIRRIDLETVLTRLDKAGKGKDKQRHKDKRLVEKYATLLECDEKPAAIEKLLHGAPHRLAPEELSPIVWVLDSVTATPAMIEVYTKDSDAAKDAKKLARGREAIELAIRSGTAGASTLGMQARAWSDELRRASFVDQKMIGILTAQLRTKGIGSGNAYKDSAEPGALKFYTRVRLSVYSMSGGVLYAHPDGGCYPKSDALSAEQIARAPIVGRKIMISVKKAATSAEFSTPGFMLGATGTDRVNTVWEALLLDGLIKHLSAGRYEPSMVVDKVKAPPTAFTRAEFVSTLYAEYLPLWKALIETQVPKAVTL